MFHFMEYIYYIRGSHMHNKKTFLVVATLLLTISTHANTLKEAEKKLTSDKNTHPKHTIEKEKKKIIHKEKKMKRKAEVKAVKAIL